MILINRVTLYSYEIHKNELYQCIEHNINNSFIDKIVIFSNNANIKLPNHEKVILVIKHKFSERDIVNYCKSRFNSNIYIYSNPFIKFDNSLIRVEEPDKECQIFNSDVFIFSNKSIIKFGDDIDSLFFRYEMFSKLTVSKIHNWTEDVRYESTLNFKRDINTNKETTIKKSTSIKLEEKIQDEVEDLSDIETFEEIKPETKIVPIVRRTVTQNSNLNESLLVKKSSKINTIISKIDIVIVSVNYNDYLSITLPENLKYNKNITVVTIGKDKECQSICENLGVKYIISNRIYQNSDNFNKGKAINDGIKSLQNPEWILLLDADTFLTEDINNYLQNKQFSNDSLITCKRLILENFEEYKKWLSEPNSVVNFEKAQGFGYFQLFNKTSNNGNLNLYPENYGDASASDLYFRSKFNSKIEIDTYVVHLGETGKNWSGRKTEKFSNKSSVFSLLENLPFYGNILEYVGKDISDDNQFIIHVSSTYRDNDLDLNRRTDLAKSTWKKLYENNKIIPYLHYTKKEELPKIKDLFEIGYGLCINDNDIIMYTNSDICLTSDLYEKIVESCNKYECTFSFRKDFMFELTEEMDKKLVEETYYSGGNDTPMGADLFAVTKSWWEKWRDYLPDDQVIGRPTWDWVFRIAMGKSIEGDVVFKQNFEDQGSICETPNITYHEHHSSYWNKSENISDLDSIKNTKIAYNWMKEKSNNKRFTGKDYFEFTYGKLLKN